MATYILIDFLNMAHRCKHVCKGDPETKAGLTVHVILNSLKKVWQEQKGTHVVFCLDGHSWRHEIYSGYKAQRKLLQSQRTQHEVEEDNTINNVLDEFITFIKTKTNVTVLHQRNAEADDLIAYFIDLHPDDNHIIVSGDTDFQQLLTDKVKIYDGVRGQLITTTGVFDDKGNEIINKKTKLPEKPPVPEWELFKKIIRGDSSDNVMSAFPGIRETKLKDAYDDRKNKGYAWNNLMLQTWEDIDGKTVRVLDQYNFNKTLIDLHCQPEHVKEDMQKTIIDAVEKPTLKQIGIWFLKFCEEVNLPSIAKVPQLYTAFLSEPYTK